MLLSVMALPPEANPNPNATPNATPNASPSPSPSPNQALPPEAAAWSADECRAFHGVLAHMAAHMAGVRVGVS